MGRSSKQSDEGLASVGPLEQEFLASLLELGYFPPQLLFEVSGDKTEKNFERPCRGYAVTVYFEESSWRIVIDALGG